MGSKGRLTTREALEILEHAKSPDCGIWDYGEGDPRMYEITREYKPRLKNL